jgi:hypothetical protein
MRALSVVARDLAGLNPHLNILDISTTFLLRVALPTFSFVVFPFSAGTDNVFDF